MFWVIEHLVKRPNCQSAILEFLLLTVRSPYSCSKTHKSLFISYCHHAPFQFKFIIRQVFIAFPADGVERKDRRGT